MKFVRNGCREKSFFRQVRPGFGDALRDPVKPMAPMAFLSPPS